MASTDRSEQHISDLVHKLVDQATRPDPCPVLAEVRAAGVSQLPGAPVLLVTSFNFAAYIAVKR